MLVHHFYNDKIAFNPNSTFITNLWNSEFFWLLPDHPSGVSIFYCPETKSVNTQELERERSLALVDKVNALDLEKLSKQKNVFTRYVDGPCLDDPEFTCGRFALFRS
jgi:hypothetical protein